MGGNFVLLPFLGGDSSWTHEDSPTLRFPIENEERKVGSFEEPSLGTESM